MWCTWHCELNLKTRNTWTLRELCDVSRYILIRCICSVIRLYCMSLQSSWLQFAAMFVLVKPNILQANIFPCSQQFNHQSQWTKYSVRSAWRRTLTVAKLRKNGFIGNEYSITFWLSYHKQTSISSRYWRTSCPPQSFNTSRSALTME